MTWRAVARLGDRTGQQMKVELADPKDCDLDSGGTYAEIELDVLVEPAGWGRSDAMIDEWGRQSFPASDPPSNW